MVYVQDINGKPMMPTTRYGKVRRLLKDKKVVVVNLCPFTIKLMYVTSDYKQEIVLGVDAGTKHVGLSATTKSKELYSSEVILRNDIVDLLSTRRELRKRNKDQYSERNVYHMITKQDIQAAASYIFRSSFVSEDQARKAMVRAGNNATKILVKTFRGKLFKKAFERARRGKDISSFERQEKESGFNFLHNPNNGRMQSGHIIIDGIGLFKQIIHER